jgi:hypothetical protein
MEGAGLSGGSVGIDKPLPHSVCNECSISPGGMRGGGAFAVILGDQPAGDIVVIARALFDRIARRHPVALAIKQQPASGLDDECVCRSGARQYCRRAAFEPHPIADCRDPRVFPRMGLPLVNDLTVLAQLVFECPRSISTPRDLAAISDNLTRFCRGSSFTVGVNGTSALAGSAEFARIADEIGVAAQVPRP